jgi:hypothetical protein
VTVGCGVLVTVGGGGAVTVTVGCGVLVTVGGGGAAITDDVVEGLVRGADTVVEGAAVGLGLDSPLLVSITTISTTTSTITVRLAATAAVVTGHRRNHRSAAFTGGGSCRYSRTGNASMTGGSDSLAAEEYCCPGSISGGPESSAASLETFGRSSEPRCSVFACLCSTLSWP